MRLGLAVLLLLYGLTATLFAASTRPQGRRASLAAALFLSLLPLSFTFRGFLEERALAPTAMLAGVAPWADPALARAIAAKGSAPNPVLLDPVSQMIPWSRAARDSLLFNPAQGSGAALLGNGQSAPLFPTEAASRLLAPFRAVTYSQAARLLVAAWGMFLLARIAGFSELGASAAAAVFVGSGFLQLWRLHPHSLVAATAPWVLAAALALYRWPGPRSAALLAAAGAVGFAGGHPETLLHVVLFAAVVAPLLARLEPDRRDALRWKRLLGWTGACALLAFLLAAPALLPFVETLRVSTEWVDRRPLGRTTVELPLFEALERLRPASALLAFGDPVAGTWRGPENLAEVGGGATGGAALFLAVLALTAGRTRRLLPIALVGLYGLLVGAHLPILSAPFGWMPILGDSLLKRLSLWWVLAAALLAADGADTLLVRRARSRRRTAIGAAVAAACAASIIALAAVAAPRAENARIWTWEGGPVAAVAVAAALALAVAKVGSAPPGSTATAGDGARDAATPLIVAALLLLALVLPRAELFRSWIPVTPPESFYSGTPALHVVVERLRELEPAGARVTGTVGALAPHSAAFYGLEEIRAYDPMTFAPYHGFLSSVGDTPPSGWVKLLDPSTPALAFLGVRFVFENALPVAAGDPCPYGMTWSGADRRRCKFPRASMRLAYEGPDAVVWERIDALPRAFFPQAWRAIEDPKAATEAAIEIDDFALLAIVDRAPPGVATNDPSALVHRLAVDHGSIDAEVETAAPAILATSQPAIPGWRLTLDGAAAPQLVRRINGAFLGVAVPAGRHRLELHYAPASWSVGLLLAACGTVIMTLLLLADRRDRRVR